MRYANESSVGGRASWAAAIPLILLAAGAAAQSAGAAEELRSAIKRELAPLRSTLAQQAKTVAGELAREALAELASSPQIRVSVPALVRNGDAGGDDDHS